VTPATATKEKPFVNSLGMRFVPVEGTDVLFCVHETRWKDYTEYARANPDIDSKWEDQTLDGFRLVDRSEDHPVVNVSWEDAVTFCKWLSEKENKAYRLPTDREWSAAVGLGRKEKWRRDDTPESVDKDQNEFPWGTDWPPPKGAGNYSDESRKAKAPNPNAQYLDGYDDGFPTTAPVMSFKPNEFGLYDLGGNVWEWVDDWWSEAKTQRVLRGGSWAFQFRPRLLSSHRNSSVPDFQDRHQGFRVVLAR
jgi:formylglycine-generating enzyme required for sulfatase activity